MVEVARVVARHTKPMSPFLLPPFFSGAEGGRRGEATLAHGCAGQCAGRSGARSRPPPPARSGAFSRRGVFFFFSSWPERIAPGQGAKRPKGGQERSDGGDRGEGLCAGRNAQRQRRERETNAPTKRYYPRAQRGRSPRRRRGRRPSHPQRMSGGQRRPYPLRPRPNTRRERGEQEWLAGSSFGLGASVASAALASARVGRFGA